MRLPIKYIILIIGAVGLIIIYKYYNPSTSVLFPKCPFLSITGYQCPGCGSQRAIHQMLNLDFLSAFRYNALLILAIPYILGAVFFASQKKKATVSIITWRKRLYGQKAIYIMLTIILVFWVGRNII